jgi:hypothetical protein
LPTTTGIKEDNKALINKGGQVPSHKQLPTLEDILKLRQAPRSNNNNITFTFIVEHLAGVVIGKRKWKIARCYNPLSTSMSVSDEAFMLLLLENQYNMWKDAETNIVGRGKYTDKAPNKKFCGWSNEGMRRFNQLIAHVRENRNKQYSKDVEEATVKSLAETYNKMLGVKRKNSRKRRRHVVPENTDDEHEDEEDDSVAEDELMLLVSNTAEVGV